MEAFFNELSVRVATNEAEAKGWFIELAEVGQLLKRIVESIQEDAFVFRRSEDFGEMPIMETTNIREFLSDHFEFSDPEYVFLLGLFDAPYITANDPLRSDYEYMNLTFDGVHYHNTGLAAAYLKAAMAISLNSGPHWDACRLPLLIERLNQATNVLEVVQPAVKHASQKRHLIECHLPFLAQSFDWLSCRPRFEAATQTQTLLPMLELYSLLLDDGDWETFYHKLAHLPKNEQIAKINNLVEGIAKLHLWQPATGNLETLNRGRTIFLVPNTDLIVSVDTEHGEFEVHRNQKGNNHLGSISFDGKRFKPAVPGRSLKL